MRKKSSNLKGYLLLNLILVSILLIGLWRGEQIFDSTVRLPSILIFLIIINSFQIFKEASARRQRSPIIHKIPPVCQLRRIVSERNTVDKTLLTDLLTAVLGQTGDEGMSLFMLDEGGFYSVATSVGAIPQQLLGARLFVANSEIRIKHPGGLGEECICRCGSPVDLIPFRSGITQLRMDAVSLNIPGKGQALWILIPGKQRLVANEYLSQIALYFEFAFSLVMGSSNSGESQTDQMTGLLKYEAFKGSLDLELDRSERYRQKMTLMMLSVSKFKDLAKASKEVVQKAVAASLKESLRRFDLSFSWQKPGGFAAILTETDSDVAKMVGERIIASFQKNLSGRNSAGANATASVARMHIGFATYPSDASHSDGLLEKAQEALDCSIREDVGIVSFAIAKEKADN